MSTFVEFVTPVIVAVLLLSILIPLDNWFQRWYDARPVRCLNCHQLLTTMDEYTVACPATDGKETHAILGNDFIRLYRRSRTKEQGA